MSVAGNRRVVYLSALRCSLQRVASTIAARCVGHRSALRLWQELSVSFIVFVSWSKFTSPSSLRQYALGLYSLRSHILANRISDYTRLVLMFSPIRSWAVVALLACSRLYALGMYRSCSYVLANTVFENVHLAPYPHQHAIG